MDILQRPNIEEIENNMNQVLATGIGKEVALELVSYIKHLEGVVNELREFDLYAITGINFDDEEISYHFDDFPYLKES